MRFKKEAILLFIIYKPQSINFPLDFVADP